MLEPPPPCIVICYGGLRTLDRPCSCCARSCGVRCVPYRRHLLSTSLSAWLLPHFSDPRLSQPFSIPASLGYASELVHRSNKRCHLPESGDWSFLPCPSSFPSPWRLCFPLPSSRFPPGLTSLSLLALLQRKDSHSHMASCPRPSPEG